MISAMQNLSNMRISLVVSDLKESLIFEWYQPKVIPTTCTHQPAKLSPFRCLLWHQTSLILLAQDWVEPAHRFRFGGSNLLLCGFVSTQIPCISTANVKLPNASDGPLSIIYGRNVRGAFSAKCLWIITLEFVCEMFMTIFFQICSCSQNTIWNLSVNTFFPNQDLICQKTLWRCAASAPPLPPE